MTTQEEGKPIEQQIPLLARVIEDFDLAESKGMEAQQTALQHNQLRRDTLFPAIESSWPIPSRLITYIARFGPEGCEIEERDIMAIGSMLGSIGQIPNLLLMINSPGGSGETAEKIIEMCRRHCTDTFRVIVPNKAKSAATLIAFGADSIVMGYCSELGPIDPQFLITVGNVAHSVSAISVIQERDELVRNTQKCQSTGRDMTAYLAQLNTSTMEPAWIRECERQVAFSMDFTKKWLSQHMLRKKHPDWTIQKLQAVARQIASNFTSANRRWTHGRMIGSDECNKIGLNIEYLDEDTTLWANIFELYTRCDYLLGHYGKAKVLLTSDSLLVA